MDGTKISNNRNNCQTEQKQCRTSPSSHSRPTPVPPLTTPGAEVLLRGGCLLLVSSCFSPSLPLLLLSGDRAGGASWGLESCVATVEACYLLVVAVFGHVVWPLTGGAPQHKELSKTVGMQLMCMHICMYIFIFVCTCRTRNPYLPRKHRGLACHVVSCSLYPHNAGVARGSWARQVVKTPPSWRYGHLNRVRQVLYMLHLFSVRALRTLALESPQKDGGKKGITKLTMISCTCSVSILLGCRCKGASLATIAQIIAATCGCGDHFSLSSSFVVLPTCTTRCLLEVLGVVHRWIALPRSWRQIE